MRARSDAGSSLFREAISCVTESSRLRDCCLRASLSSAVLPSPNNFSNSTCGLCSIGSGSVGVFQEIVLVYAHP